MKSPVILRFYSCLISSDKRPSSEPQFQIKRDTLYLLFYASPRTAAAVAIPMRSEARRPRPRPHPSLFLPQTGGRKTRERAGLYVAFNVTLSPFPSSLPLPFSVSFLVLKLDSRQSDLSSPVPTHAEKRLFSHV